MLCLLLSIIHDTANWNERDVMVLRCSAQHLSGWLEDTVIIYHCRHCYWHQSRFNFFPSDILNPVSAPAHVIHNNIICGVDVFVTGDSDHSARICFLPDRDGPPPTPTKRRRSTDGQTPVSWPVSHSSFVSCQCASVCVCMCVRVCV